MGPPANHGWKERLPTTEPYPGTLRIKNSGAYPRPSYRRADPHPPPSIRTFTEELRETPERMLTPGPAEEEDAQIPTGENETAFTPYQPSAHHPPHNPARQPTGPRQQQQSQNNPAQPHQPPGQRRTQKLGPSESKYHRTEIIAQAAGGYYAGQAENFGGEEKHRPSDPNSAGPSGLVKGEESDSKYTDDLRRAHDEFRLGGSDVRPDLLSVKREDERVEEGVVAVKKEGGGEEEDLGVPAVKIKKDPDAVFVNKKDTDAVFVKTEEAQAPPSVEQEPVSAATLPIKEEDQTTYQLVDESVIDEEEKTTYELIDETSPVKEEYELVDEAPFRAVRKFEATENAPEEGYAKKARHNDLGGDDHSPAPPTRRPTYISPLANGIIQQS